MLHKNSLPYVISISIAVAALGAPQAAYAAGVVGNGAPASCTEAALVSALAGGGAISFNCGPNPHTIAFTSRKTINTNTSINGAGKITFDGGGTTGFFSVAAARTLSLAGLTVTNAGNASSPSTGLAIAVGSGTLSVASSTFSQNTRGAISGFNTDGVTAITNSLFISNSNSGFGGAIYNTGQLFISDSMFKDNVGSSSHEGGAIYNTATGGIPGKVTIRRSSFIRNTAGYGGAISNYGALTMTESTLAANGTTFNGGGGGGTFLNGSGGQLLLVNVTLTGGTAMPNNKGSAIYVNGSPVIGGRATLVNVTMADNAGVNGQVHIANVGEIYWKNTIVANGQCTKDASAVLNDNGGNLAFNATGCPGTNADPLLGTLQDNGGPTHTRALPANSPARDQGLNSGCPAYDQRGVIRPQNATCDIGAVEYNATPIFTAVSPDTLCADSGSATLTFTGSNLIDGPFGTRVKLGGVALATTFVANTSLSAVLGAAELAAPPHTLTFTLETPTVDGGVSAASHSVAIVVCNQPIAGLTAANDGPTVLGNVTQFEATITNGGGVSYVWNFGDGQIGAGANPTHTYTSVGSYVAIVTATNNVGQAAASTVVNVNLITTGKLISSFTSQFGAVITYTYIVTHVAPEGGSAATVVLSGSVPANTVLVTYAGASAVATGGDYGNGYVATLPPLSLAPGQSAAITWVVRSTTVVGDVVNQAHASTDDGRIQVFERDRVYRVFLMMFCKGC